MNQTYAQDLADAIYQKAHDVWRRQGIDLLGGSWDNFANALDIDKIIASVAISSPQSGVPAQEPVAWKEAVEKAFGHLHTAMLIDDRERSDKMVEDAAVILNTLLAAPVAQPSCKDCGKPTPPDSIHTCSPQYKPTLRPLSDAEINQLAYEIGMGEYKYCDDPQRYYLRFARAVLAAAQGGGKP